MAAYKALLHRASFPAPDRHKVYFEANKGVVGAVNAQLAGQGEAWISPGRRAHARAGGALVQGRAGGEWATPLVSDRNKPWVDDELANLLNMIAQKSTNDSFITGFNLLADARKYHSARRTEEVGNEIYGALVAGKIVILDLSVGRPSRARQHADRLAPLRALHGQLHRG